jgi:hypothetical protein
MHKTTRLQAENDDGRKVTRPLRYCMRTKNIKIAAHLRCISSSRSMGQTAQITYSVVLPVRESNEIDDSANQVVHGRAVTRSAQLRGLSQWMDAGHDIRLK